MKDFILVIDTDHSVFQPQTDSAKNYLIQYNLPTPWRVPTHEFSLPMHMTHIENSGLTLEVQDERGRKSEAVAAV